MAAFVPFFEKSVSGETPQFQFTQQHFSQLKLSKVTVAPTQAPRPMAKEELKPKLLSDLKNALYFALPESSLQQIMDELASLRMPSSMSPGESQMDMGAEDPEASAAKPSVKLQKDGDKVTNIMVECECGQVIALDCIY